MPTSKPKEDIVNSLKAGLVLHMCMCLHENECGYARPILQEFFNGMMRMDDGSYRAKRPNINSTLRDLHASARKEIPSLS